MMGVVIVEDSFGVCAQKKYVHAFTHKKKLASRQQQWLDLGYLTQKMQVFSMFLICQYHTKQGEKSIHKLEIIAT
jgi:hypothetical protein